MTKEEKLISQFLKVYQDEELTSAEVEIELNKIIPVLKSMETGEFISYSNLQEGILSFLSDLEPSILNGIVIDLNTAENDLLKRCISIVSELYDHDLKKPIRHTSKDLLFHYLSQLLSGDSSIFHDQIEDYTKEIEELVNKYFFEEDIDVEEVISRITRLLKELTEKGFRIVKC